MTIDCDRQPLLSICIPIYKRPHLLSQCLQSIVDSGRDYFDSIQVVITDDSTDETNRSVRDLFSQIIPQFKWINNSANMGIDRNILNAVNSSDGKYIWIIGEDDLLVKAGIGNILSFLSQQEQELPFICSNYAYVSEDWQTVMKERVLDIQDEAIVTADIFMRDYMWAIGFIGACIVNRESWHRIDSDRYIGTFFAHVGTIMAGIANRSVAVLPTPLVLNRCGDLATTWNDVAFDVYHGWYRMVDLLAPYYTEEIRTQSKVSYRNGLGVDSIKFLISRRAIESFDRNIYIKYYRDGAYPASYKIAAYIISLLDPTFWQSIISIYIKTKKTVGMVKRSTT
jgi:glycosyltransferase involved in cell wall biosynthesis